MQNGGRASKIFGEGPGMIEESMVQEHLKYDSAGKQFQALQTRGFTYATDAVVLVPHKQRK